LFLSMQYPKENLLFDISDKKGPQDFLRQFLPDHVVNGIGHPEDSLAYILRHTQLMPRQLLLILNSIFQLAYSDEVKTYPVVDATSVVVGIKHVESRLTQEVCSAFRNRYPELKAVCESVIKYLPLIFDEGILHNVFNLHGKKAFALGDFDDFKRMLVEAAVVGRVVNDVGDRYVEGMFEYTAAHKLIISTDDKLCLHPIFAEVFHFKKSSDDRAIYPWGTDPDCDDYRDHQLWI
ncbi:MAG: hypothetical protein ACKOPN_08430, partial [Prochlorococcaceae cyanobacterium]